MVEIIPNWHPIFVHFTIALISTSALCYLIGYSAIKSSVGQELLIVGRWCLWLGAIAVIATFITGFIAYHTVLHDTISHVAMTTHRNWAITSFIFILLMSAWSLWLYFKNKLIISTFIIGMIIAFLLVNVTAWYGAELVYRHGVGVITLPQREPSSHLPKHSNEPPHGDSHEQPHTH